MSKKDFLKNLTKSMGTASIDAAGDMMPTLKRGIKSNKDLALNTYTKFKTRDNSKNMKDTYLFKSTKKLIDNALNDFKSGNFNNKTRKTDDPWEKMFNFDDMDNMFGDSLEGGSSGDLFNNDSNDSLFMDEGLNSGNSIKSNSDNTNNMAINVSNDFDEESKFDIKSTAKINAANLKVASMGFATMTSQLNLINNFYNENTVKFYESMESKAATMEQSLSLVKDYLTDLSNNRSKQHSGFGGGSSSPSRMDIYGLEGLAITEWISMYKQNKKGSSKSDYKSAFDFLIKPEIEKLVANPLGFGMKKGIKMALPKKLKNSIGDIDRLASILPVLGQNKFKDWSKNGNFFQKTIGKFLNLDNFKSSFGKYQYNKGAISFDGVTKRAITHVIPGYLGKILNVVSSALGNKKENLVYDYETGKFIDTDQVKKFQKAKSSKAISRELSFDTDNGDIEKFKDNVLTHSKKAGLSDDKSKELYANIPDIMEKMIKSGKTFTTVESAKDLGLSEQEAQIFMNAFTSMKGRGKGDLEKKMAEAFISYQDSLKQMKNDDLFQQVYNVGGMSAKDMNHDTKKFNKNDFINSKLDKVKENISGKNDTVDGILKAFGDNKKTKKEITEMFTKIKTIIGTSDLDSITKQNVMTPLSIIESKIHNDKGITKQELDEAMANVSNLDLDPKDKKKISKLAKSIYKHYRYTGGQQALDGLEKGVDKAYSFFTKNTMFNKEESDSKDASDTIKSSLNIYNSIMNKVPKNIKNNKAFIKMNSVVSGFANKKENTTGTVNVNPTTKVEEETPTTVMQDVRNNSNVGTITSGMINKSKRPAIEVIVAGGSLDNVSNINKVNTVTEVADVAELAKQEELSNKNSAVEQAKELKEKNDKRDEALAKNLEDKHKNVKVKSIDEMKNEAKQDALLENLSNGGGNGSGEGGEEGGLLGKFSGIFSKGKGKLSGLMGNLAKRGGFLGKLGSIGQKLGNSKLLGKLGGFASKIGIGKLGSLAAGVAGGGSLLGAGLSAGMSLLGNSGGGQEDSSSGRGIIDTLSNVIPFNRGTTATAEVGENVAAAASNGGLLSKLGGFAGKIGGKASSFASKIPGLGKITSKLPGIGGKALGLISKVPGIGRIGKLGGTALGLASKIPGIGGLIGKGAGLLGGLGGVAAGASTAATAATGGASALGMLGKGAGMLGKLGGFAKFLGPIGLALTAGQSLFSGVSGWKNADETFGTLPGEATTGQKASSALGSALSSLTFGLIGKDTISKGIYGLGSGIGKVAKTAIKYSPIGLAGSLLGSIFGKKKDGDSLDDSSDDSSGGGTSGSTKETPTSLLQKLNDSSKATSDVITGGPFTKIFGGRGLFMSMYQGIIAGGKGLLGFFKNLFSGKDKDKDSGSTTGTATPAGSGTGYKGMGIWALSAKYETGNDNGGDPGSISNDAGDPGGKSYGISQFSLNTGSLREFVSSLKTTDPSIYNRLSKYQLASSGFDQEWKAIAKEDPEKFKQLQGNYSVKEFYDPLMNKLSSAGLIDPSKTSSAVQSALYSMAVQNGVGGSWSLLKGSINKNMTQEQLIDTIYRVRTEHIQNNRPSSMSASVAAGCINRFQREKADALEILKQDEYRAANGGTINSVGSSGSASGGGSGVIGQIMSNYKNDVLGHRYFLGNPQSPSTGYDCSGSIQYAYEKAGISIPSVTWDQKAVGRVVNSVGEAQPGDLMFSNNTGHVTMYAGNGMVYAADSTKSGIRYRPIRTNAGQYNDGVSGIRRYLDQSGNILPEASKGVYKIPNGQKPSRSRNQLPAYAGTARNVGPQGDGGISSGEAARYRKMAKNASPTNEFYNSENSKMILEMKNILNDIKNNGYKTNDILLKILTKIGGSDIMQSGKDSINNLASKIKDHQFTMNPEIASIFNGN